MLFKCQICNINPSNSFLTKCCKLFICEQCKIKYENSFLQCVCNKAIVNKKLCIQNQQLHRIISQFQSKKRRQCDRCSQFAVIECKNCCMVFCKSCEKQLHNAIGYSKHIREEYVQKVKPLTQIIQRAINRPQICLQHKQFVQFVCQCSHYLCCQCIKPHKQTCQRLTAKPKPISQFKAQFHSHLLYKLSQITNYKQSLQDQHKQFINYFTKQKESYEMTSNSLDEQFSALQKMLQIKTQQNKRLLNQYWQECEKVHKKTIFFLQTNLRKYDDYAKMIQKFSQDQIGLDYLQKRIKRIPHLTYNSFIFKANNIQEVKSSILSINISWKSWQYQFHQNIALNLEELVQQKQKKASQVMRRSDILTSQIMRRSDVLTSQMMGRSDVMTSQVTGRSDVVTTTPASQLLFQVSQNPLNPRILSFISSHNQVQFGFLHMPYQNFKYEIQYGVGFKMKGKEIFKRIQNKTGNGVIQGLNPSTKYRIRMRVGQGQFGQISEVTTLDSPKFYIQPGNTMKNTSQSSFQFLKQGVIYATNPIIFGVHFWTVILNSEKSSYDQSLTACITVGISNKQQKKPMFVGSTFNYGYQRDQIIVKLMLNCQQQTMTISNSQNIQSQQKFSNLPAFPIFPAIQNKSSTTIHIKYSFGKDQNC